MRPSTLWFLLKSGFKNIRRNWMFSLASVITMVACIFLFGIFFSIIRNVSYITHHVEEQVPITVFFEEGTDVSDIKAVGDLIAARPEVSRVEFVSADEAWKKMKETYFGDSDAAEGFRDVNPLANSSNYQVYLADIEMQNVLAAYIRGLDHVREVNQSEQAAVTLGNFNRVLSYISVAVIAILLIISVFLISNTVHVGIAVRSEEIGIMKYIGATDAFVRAPFVLEGLLLGLAGAAIPLVILYFIYNRTVSYILERFSLLSGTIRFIPAGTIFQVLIPVGLCLGIGIGLAGSFLTTRRHLRV
ncbi:MAG: permease-like cell division protein FtsX [Blautia sp.]|nr:permease-like cell division protein FtsX [Blautia sp.]